MKPNHRHFVCIVALLICAAAAAPTSAQPLADRVPADSILYIGWRGAEDPGSAYAGSHLQAIIDQSNFKALFNDFLPRAILKIGQKDKHAAEAFGAITAIGGPLWRHPTAIFFDGVNGAGPRGPVPKFALICKAGADSGSLLQTFQSLIEKAHDADNAMLRASQAGDLVVVSTGYGEGEPIAAGVEQPGGPKGLDAIGPERTFAAVLGQVQNDPLSIVYVNIEKAIDLVDQFVGAEGGEARDKWVKIRDALGLQGLRHIIVTTGFDGQDFATQAFVDAPAPRKGVALLMEGSPISEELLKSAPQDASFVMAASFDPGKIIEGIRSTTAEIDPDAKVKVDQGLGAVSMFLGKNLQTEILDPLGDQWLVYASPTVAGRGLTGAILINKLDDPKKAEQGLQSLAIAICNGINGQMHQKDVAIRYQQTKIGDLNVNYIAIPLITPAWAIKDGYLYAGLFPQNVATAARAAAAARGGKSITNNPDFVAMRKRLNIDHPTSISYLDMRPNAAEGYQMVLALTRLGLGFGDMAGLKAPEPLWPTFDAILPHLAPAGGVSYVDEAGFHARSVMPFPGAQLLAGQQGLGVAAPAMLAGIALPAMARAKAQAQAVGNMSNLRQVSLACVMYATDHDGKLPPDLATLVRSGALEPNVLISPQSGRSLPNDFAKMKPEQAANWIARSSDVVYTGAGKTTNDKPAETILAYENWRHGDLERIGVAYVDGHVEMKARQEAEALIKKQEADEHAGNNK